MLPRVVHGMSPYQTHPWIAFDDRSETLDLMRPEQQALNYLLTIWQLPETWPSFNTSHD